jgi:geranyl-CoA carboxylase alpha subunit
VGYRGAGTVEFIVDADKRHYFLEMNTRLQVEHPVTECITGFDLVEWQLRVAQGEPLPVVQHEIRFDGHAIEARLYAEDPYDGWKPQTGRILGWNPERSGIRIDHGIAAGGEVTPYYDAMVAKFIAHGRDRDDAIRRLTRALAEVPLMGLRHNGRFLRDLLQHPQFCAGTMTTTRLDDWAAGGEPLLQRPVPPDVAWRLAAALRARAGTAAVRPDSVSRFTLTLACEGEQRTLQAPPDGLHVLSWHGTAVRYAVDGVQRQALAIDDGQALHLALDGDVFIFTEPSPYPASDRGADPGRARAPVAGVVAHVAVQAGDAVATGAPLVCVEAMKMEMWLHAAASGVVRAVHVAPKDPVATGAVLVEIDVEEA